MFKWTLADDFQVHERSRSGEQSKQHCAWLAIKAGQLRAHVLAGEQEREGDPLDPVDRPPSDNSSLFSLFRSPFISPFYPRPLWEPFRVFFPANFKRAGKSMLM